MSLPRNQRRTVVAGAATLLWIGSFGPAAAATITEWDIGGSDGQSAIVLSSAPDTSAVDLSATGVTSWPGGFCCFTAAADWASAATPDLGKYFSFSVSADPGHSIVYQSITLALFRGQQGGNHGAEGWQLRTSVDGFAAALLSFDISASAADEQVLFASQDISALGTQPGTVEFRLYGFDYTSPTDYSGLGNQPGATPLTGSGSNLILEGLVSPEPSTALLVGLGLVALSAHRRSRHR